MNENNNINKYKIDIFINLINKIIIFKKKILFILFPFIFFIIMIVQVVYRRRKEKLYNISYNSFNIGIYHIK